MFNLGVGLAMAEVQRTYGADTIVCEVLAGFGLGLSDLIATGMEEFDLAPLRDVLDADHKTKAVL
jgi:hypothetical protein